MRILLLLLLTYSAQAIESPPPQVVGKSKPVLKAKPVKKRRRVEVKETEGTEAPGRFEAETILKSQYKINEQPLEVDTD